MSVFRAVSNENTEIHDGSEYYRLTRFGRRLLAIEITRLEGVIRKARSHLRVQPEKA